MSFDMEPDHDEHVECGREIERLQAENRHLQSIVDALPKCSRLVEDDDGKRLVQDVAVELGKTVVYYKRPDGITQRCIPFAVSLGVQLQGAWLSVAWTEGGIELWTQTALSIPITLCGNSPEAAEFAKAKGASHE